MPELPDILSYIGALEPRVVGHTLESVVVRSPFLMRTFDPPADACVGQSVEGVERVGKRIVLTFPGDRFLVFHLMIAGRFRWRGPGTTPRSRHDLATFGFEAGTLLLTEAGTKKRASLHVVVGRDSLGEFDRGGIDIQNAGVEEFIDRLRLRNHTLKRALTDPTLFDGIGNAYSDEILHRARLSPVRWTSRLSDEECERLFTACCETLTVWTERLRSAPGDPFPDKVTAFRPEMAVHGKYQQACPECGEKIQRIVYASRETNYCARCQTGGKLLADRALSRLLRGDWPRTLEELEEHRRSLGS